MSSEEYEKGIQIGELIGELKALRGDFSDYKKTQEDIIGKQDKRIALLEQYVQTNVGKNAILMIIFSAVGTIIYLAVSWLLSNLHIKI